VAVESAPPADFQKALAALRRAAPQPTRRGGTVPRP
jgi:hypothetical protein